MVLHLGTPTCYCAGLISIYNKFYLQLLQQRFTYFCNAQICNTISFFSKNKWQRKYLYLTCLIRFSLSTFRTYMKIWWCFGSYLWSNVENSKGFTNFQAALYFECNLFLWWESWMFSIITSLLQSSFMSLYPPEIILICWFADKETFIINVENSCAA